MVEEGTDEGPTNEPLIVSGYNGDGLISRKCSPITSSLGGYSVPAESGIIDELGLTVAEEAWSLYVGRLSLGFGTAVFNYVGPVYVADITPKNLRGGFSSLVQRL
ncbi:hypothetical protein GOBAR_DD02970 [Gossypium barbadense]|nr:hypothetical protein GOBAR_DD02970 [Gossypium barbadense]